MKQRPVFFLIIGLIVSAALFTACELIVGESGTYNLTIDLGNAFDSGGRAITTPPYDMLTYTVTVTAPDIEPFQKTVSRGARFINMAVPTGHDRNIRLDATIDPAEMAAVNHEHVLSLAGDVTVDLLPGRVVRCFFNMTPGEMKLVFPDYRLDRLARIPDMHASDAGLTSDWAMVGADNVYDVDYDDAGRIYYGASGGATVYARDQLTAGGSVTNSSTVYSCRPVIAVDANRNRLYVYVYAAFSSTTQNFLVYFSASSMTLDGSIMFNEDYIPMTIGSTDPVPVSAIAAEDNILYIARNDTSPNIYRCVLNAAGDTIIAYASTTMTADFEPLDLIIKGKYLYATNCSASPSEPAIVVFDKNTLAHVGSYGVRTTIQNDPAAGHFYGPKHFIAPRNRGFYVIDERAGAGFNRIVSFNDLRTWSGWDTFEAADIELDDFGFYEP